MSGTENCTEFCIKCGDSNDKSGLLHELLLTNPQVSRVHEPFANGLSVNTEFSNF